MGARRYRRFGRKRTGHVITAIIPSIDHIIKRRDQKIDTSLNRDKSHAAKNYSGLPPPADDHMEDKLDFNKHLVKHPNATFFAKANGRLMVKAKLNPGDIFVGGRKS